MNALGFIRPATLIILGVVAISFSLGLASRANHWEDVSALAFSPDSKTLAAGTYDGKHFNEDFHWRLGALVQVVALFDAETGSEHVVIDESTGPSGASPASPPGQFVSFSPDGETLAIGTWEGSVKLWDMKSKSLKGTLQAKSPHVAAVAFSSDGRTLVARFRFSLTVWYTAKYGDPKESETYATGNSLGIYPAGNLLVAGDRMGGGPEIWDVAQERPKKVIGSGDFRVFCLKSSPDGRLLAMGGEKSAILWDMVEDSKQFELEGSWVRDVAFSPDGRTLATAGVDGLRFWNTETGWPIDSIRAPKRVRSINYSPDGRLLATGDYGGKVTIWNIETRKAIWSAPVDHRCGSAVLAWATGIVGLLLFLMAAIAFWKETKIKAPVLLPGKKV